MEFKEVIKNRRSIRKYKPEKVPDEIVSRILEAARIAPTWANMQGVRYVVVLDEGKVESLKTAIGQKWTSSASMFIVAISDEKWSGKNKNGLCYYMLDVGICFQQLILAATNEGLATCWIGHFDENKVRSILDVPEKHQVVAITPLGYADGETKDTSRKALNEIAFRDKFGNPWA